MHYRQANKSLVIEQAPAGLFIRDLVESGNLIMLRADWTRPSDDIAGFLASYQRYGIPLILSMGRMPQTAFNLVNY